MPVRRGKNTKKKYRALSSFLSFAHFAVTAVTAARALITCLAIVEKDLHDAIDRETGAWSSPSPVAVVTASSRMSLGSVLLFFLCSSRPIIGMDEHWRQPSHGGACWWSTVGDLAREFRDIRLLAVTTVLRGRLDHVPFAQMFQHLSKWSMHRAHQALLFSHIG